MNQAFDELAKALAEDVSRREALRRVGSVLATALLASFGLKTAWGACPPGKTPCNGKCVNLQTDNKNCGSCGTVCAKGQSCVNGTCTSGGGSGGGGGCPSGQTRCNGKCVDLQTDFYNCGSCGYTCGAGQICCSGSCVDPTSLENCGRCGNVCTGGRHCFAGVYCTCWPEQSVCNDTCVNLQTDSQNCGTCGQTCSTGQACCGGTCVDVTSNRDHCGLCGIRCGDYQVCTDYNCVCTKTVCGGACVDTQTDPNNCGACGVHCSTGQCVAGACVCDAGWNNCGPACCPPTTVYNGTEFTWIGCQDNFTPTCLSPTRCLYSNGSGGTLNICPS